MRLALAASLLFAPALASSPLVDQLDQFNGTAQSIVDDFLLRFGLEDRRVAPGDKAQENLLKAGWTIFGRQGNCPLSDGSNCFDEDICCSGGDGAFCCDAETPTCCGREGDGYCCGPDTECCGRNCCLEGFSCCGDAFDGTCCGEDQICCNSGAFCCDSDQTCGNTSCVNAETTVTEFDTVGGTSTVETTVEVTSTTTVDITSTSIVEETVTVTDEATATEWFTVTITSAPSRRRFAGETPAPVPAIVTVDAAGKPRGVEVVTMRAVASLDSVANDLMLRGIVVVRQNVDTITVTVTTTSFTVSTETVEDVEFVTEEGSTTTTTEFLTTTEYQNADTTVTSTTTRTVTPNEILASEDESDDGTSTDDGDDDDDNNAAIIGGAVGGAVGAIALALLGWFLWRRRNKKDNAYQAPNQPPPPTAEMSGTPGQHMNPGMGGFYAPGQSPHSHKNVTPGGTTYNNSPYTPPPHHTGVHPNGGYGHVPAGYDYNQQQQHQQQQQQGYQGYNNGYNGGYQNYPAEMGTEQNQWVHEADTVYPNQRTERVELASGPPRQ